MVGWLESDLQSWIEERIAIAQAQEVEL